MDPLDARSLAELFPEAYTELREIAERSLARERADHTLQATALVHEAYLRLSRQRKREYADRSHFLAMAATMIRRILIDHGRAHRVRGRAGSPSSLDLADDRAQDARSLTEILHLDEALTRLAVKHPRKARLVEMRFFGGLALADTARLLEISKRTASEDWTFARAWLRREMEG